MKREAEGVKERKETRKVELTKFSWFSFVAFDSTRDPYHEEHLK